MPVSENLAHSEFQSMMDLGMSCSEGVESEESGESEGGSFEERTGVLVRGRGWGRARREWTGHEGQREGVRRRGE